MPLPLPPLPLPLPDELLRSSSDVTDPVLGGVATRGAGFLAGGAVDFAGRATFAVVVGAIGVVADVVASTLGFSRPTGSLGVPADPRSTTLPATAAATATDRTRPIRNARVARRPDRACPSGSGCRSSR